VRALHSEHSALYDSVSSFGDVARRRDLREKVLGVSTHASMLVRANDGYITFGVDAGIEIGELGQDGASDASVPKGYV
jgi:hypothetical protein